MFKKILVSTAALAMMTGAALAQSEGTSALDNKDMMKPFYTDDTMKTMRSNDEIAAAVKAMSTEDKAKIAKECENAQSPRDTFCQSFNQANKM